MRVVAAEAQSDDGSSTMARILIPFLLLALAWLLYRQGVLTSTVPGPDQRRPVAEDASLSARLDRAGDLVLQGPGASAAQETEEAPQTADADHR